MKKPRLAKKFLEELALVPIVSSVCSKVGLARNTVYRWREEDLEFKQAMDKAMAMGIDYSTDIAESGLIKAARDGKPWAIKYFLDNNKKNYVRPRPKSFWEKYAPNENKIEKITIEIVPGRKPDDEAPQEIIKEAND